MLWALKREAQGAGLHVSVRGQGLLLTEDEASSSSSKEGAAQCRARLRSLGKRGLFLTSASIIYQLRSLEHIMSFLCEIGVISQEYCEDKNIIILK